jgi:hypothetical protein
MLYMSGADFFGRVAVARVTTSTPVDSMMLLPYRQGKQFLKTSLVMTADSEQNASAKFDLALVTSACKKESLFTSNRSERCKRIATAKIPQSKPLFCSGLSLY